MDNQLAFKNKKSTTKTQPTLNLLLWACPFGFLLRRAGLLCSFLWRSCSFRWVLCRTEASQEPLFHPPFTFADSDLSGTRSRWAVPPAPIRWAVWSRALPLNLWIRAQLRLGSILDDTVINTDNSSAQICSLFALQSLGVGYRLSQLHICSSKVNMLHASKIVDCKKTRKKNGATFPTTYLCKVWAALHIWKQLAFASDYCFFSVLLVIWDLAMEVGRSFYRSRCSTSVAGLFFFLKHLYWLV